MFEPPHLYSLRDVLYLVNNGRRKMENQNLFSFAEEEKKRVIREACSKLLGRDREECIRILEKPTGKPQESNVT